MKSTSKPTNCKLCGKPKLTQLIGGLFDDRYGAPGIYRVSTCQNCGFCQTSPQLTDRQIGSFYAKYYPLSQVDLSSITKNPEPPSKPIRYLLGLGHTCHWYTKKGDRVLDVGSGMSRSLVEIKQLGGIAYGVEPDPTAGKIAKQLGLKVYTGLLTDNPYPQMKFDLITASQVIEHESDPVRFLRAVRAKLKPGGLAVLSTPNMDSLARQFYGRYWINWHMPYHLSLFNHVTLSYACRLAGLKLAKHYTVTPNNWLVMNFLAYLSRKESKVKKPSRLWQLSAKSFFARAFFASLLILATIPARIMDWLGRGESLVFILQKD